MQPFWNTLILCDIKRHVLKNTLKNPIITMVDFYVIYKLLKVFLYEQI